MVWVGNVVLLAALSWLPSALIFGALWFLGSRIDAAPRARGSPQQRALPVVSASACSSSGLWRSTRCSSRW